MTGTNQDLQSVDRREPAKKDDTTGMRSAKYREGRSGGADSGREEGRDTFARTGSELVLIRALQNTAIESLPWETQPPA